MQNICVLKMIEYALYLIYSFIYSEKNSKNKMYIQNFFLIINQI